MRDSIKSRLISKPEKAWFLYELEWLLMSFTSNGYPINPEQSVINRRLDRTEYFSETRMSG
jgi:hypothetical protein